MTRHEMWRMQYQSKRYLEHATLEQLSQRIRDISCNLTLLADDGKITFRLPNEGEFNWMELFTHTQEEHILRGIDFQPGLMATAVLPKPTFPLCPKSADVIQGHQLNPGKFLVKYGKHKHLKDGSIRISPASSWKESPNPAIYDDELNKSLHAHPANVRIQVVKNKIASAGKAIQPIGNVTFTRHANRDYYALCLSCVYDYRLFDDFDADCCLIINNPMLFGQRLEIALRSHLPDWKMFIRKINYYDPFNFQRDQLNVQWSKDFKFWYQDEYRFAWINSDTAKLQPLDVQIGPVEDFGEIFQLA
jgi:hypothetical protein